MRPAILSLACLLASCTTYKDGVSSYWPRPDVLVVSGAGNGFTDSQAVADFVWLQAAQKALASGYRYFVLLQTQNTSTTTTGTLYTPTTTTFNATRYGNYVSGSSTTSGGAYNYPIFKPGLDAAFQMFEEVPTGYRMGQYWDAVDVYNELGPKYLKPFVPSGTTVLPARSVSGGAP